MVSRASVDVGAEVVGVGVGRGGYCGSAAPGDDQFDRKDADLVEAVGGLGFGEGGSDGEDGLRTRGSRKESAERASDSPL